MALIVCEIGQNFLGSIPLAKKLIELAKENGGDLCKFQLYQHNVLYKDHPEIPNYELSKEQAFELFNYGKEIGIEVFFSVFDVEKVKWCEEMGVKRYKIAYSQKRNMELKMACWESYKPVILSTNSLYEAGGDYLLYCVPHYPTELSELHLTKVDWERFEGISDHTIGLDAAKIALARGAQIIEKHFSISHDVGVDGVWSMTPDELKELKRWGNICKEIL